MSNNKNYIEIINKINEINNNKFEIKTFRTAIEILNNAKYYYNQNKISKQELNNIYKQLKKVIKTKLLEINPYLSDKVLNKICKCCERDYSSLPNDISVLNNDIVFYQEECYAHPYENNILILNDSSKEKYKEASNYQLKDEEIELTTKIITLIDEIIRSYFIYSESPLLFIQNNKIKFDNSIKPFLSINLNDKHKEKKFTIKLAIVEDWNEFHLLETNFVFEDNEITYYNWKKTDNNTWNLSSELNKTNKLIRKKTLPYTK